MLLPHPLRPSCRRPVLAVAGLLCAASVLGAPDAPDADALQHLLQSKGLVPATASGAAAAPAPLVQRLRDSASELVLSSMNFLGVAYRRGGDSAESGFDCSGFTRHVFEHSIGLVLPRRADQQARTAGLASVPREQLRPGDLVFFNTMRRAFSHVGIYIGDGRFIHAPRSGSEVRIEDMRQAYWSKRFNGARRAEAVTPAPAPASAATSATAAAPATEALAAATPTAGAARP